jgi:6-phosphogluconolactonase (cycloisomerase 2 family)
MLNNGVADIDGHLYMQSNDSENSVIHFLRSHGGTLTEADRCATGGSGAGSLNFRSNPQGLVAEGANSMAVTPDRRFLFTTNVGDNSVSSFAIGQDGSLTLLDVKATGNPINGQIGTAKSLSYSTRSGTLYVLHTIGPENIRLISVDGGGMLSVRPESYTAAPPDKPGRLNTMVVVDPNDRFLIVGSSIDQFPTVDANGTANLWFERDGKRHSIFPNNPDPDGWVVFPIAENGLLGEPMFQDAGGSSPWCPLFLNQRPDRFAIGYATSDGVALATLSSDGIVSVGPVVEADTSRGKPSALCWMTLTPDDKFVFTTMTGYGYITSWRIDKDAVSIAKDPACQPVPGDGTFRGLNGKITSGPTDIWISPDGSFVYQIYPNASELIGYRVGPDGELNEVTKVEIPYNTSTGLAGF